MLDLRRTAGILSLLRLCSHGSTLDEGLGKLSWQSGPRMPSAPHWLMLPPSSRSAYLLMERGWLLCLITPILGLAAAPALTARLVRQDSPSSAKSLPRLGIWQKFLGGPHCPPSPSPLGHTLCPELPHVPLRCAAKPDRAIPRPTLARVGHPFLLVFSSHLSHP